MEGVEIAMNLMIEKLSLTATSERRMVTSCRTRQQVGEFRYIRSDERKLFD